VIKNEEITIPGPKPLSYAYCSDTKYFKRLPSFVKDVDLLYHEATFDMSMEELASATGHSTTSDAAKTASEAGADALLIGHFSARYRDINPLVGEARTIFPRTFAAIDGQTYDIGNINKW
jgi:ribonuclease Z